MTDWHCWDLAKAASAHDAGDNSLHADHEHAHEIYETSTMSALLAAAYDGPATYGEMAGHGDFGVGTFNGLDGEMIALNGQFFHLHSDGTASVADPSDRTPFAVTFFRTPDGRSTSPLSPAPSWSMRMSTSTSRCPIRPAPWPNGASLTTERWRPTLILWPGGPARRRHGHVEQG
jgi:hypothetical protein